MSGHNRKETSNPFLLFIVFAFVAYLTIWAFKSWYDYGKFVAVAHPHYAQKIEKNSEGKKENKFKLDKISKESIAYGRLQYMANCKSCHGEKGLGNGSAGKGLSPPPRNFTLLETFVNGYAKENIYKTLETGVPGTSMASFAYLPEDDLISIVHFIRNRLMSIKEDEETILMSEKSAMSKTKKNTSAKKKPEKIDFLDVELDDEDIIKFLPKGTEKKINANKKIVIKNSDNNLVKLEKFFQNDLRNTYVAPYAHIYLFKNLKEKITSYELFKSFITSQNMFFYLGEDFSKLKDEELKSVYNKILENQKGVSK